MSALSLTCADVCGPNRDKGKEGGAGASAFFHGLLGAVGLSTPEVSPSNDMLGDIQKNLQQLQITFNQTVGDVIGGMQPVIIKEFQASQVLIELANKSLETTLSGAIGMNTELIYFYGIIIALLVLSEVFKRRG